MSVNDLERFTPEDTRAMVMQFSPAQPLIVSPRVYQYLQGIGFLDCPEMDARIKQSQPIPRSHLTLVK